MFKNIFLHWKSSSAGILSTAIVVLPLTTAPGGPFETNAHAKWYVETAMALARVWIGFISKDPGKEEAKLPDGSTAVVDSHEVPVVGQVVK